MARSMKNLAPVDPEVRLPDAVVKAAARAEEMRKAMHEAPPQDPTPVKIVEAQPQQTRTQVQDVLDTGPVTPEPVHIPTNPHPNAQNSDENADLRWMEPPKEGQTAENQPKTSQNTPQTTQNQPKTTQNGRDFERELAASQGRLGKAQDHIRELSTRLNQLEGMVVSLTQSTTPREMQAESLITPAERETWGDDMLSVVEKKVKEVVGQRLDQVAGDVTQLKGAFGQVASQQQQTAQERMWSNLDQLVPGWEVINNSNDFKAWVGLPDDASGAIRQQLMMNAFQSGNAQRVAWFFKAYRNETAPNSPAGDPTPTPRAQPGKVPLENLAAPGRATSAPASQTTAPEKPFIKRSQINQFYARSNTGHYNQNPKEKLRLEQLIFDAMAEGRVIEG